MLTIPTNSAGLVTVTITGANVTDAGAQTWTRAYMNQAGSLSGIGSWTDVAFPWQASSGATSWTTVASHAATHIQVTVTPTGEVGTVNWMASITYVSASIST